MSSPLGLVSLNNFPRVDKKPDGREKAVGLSPENYTSIFNNNKFYYRPIESSNGISSKSGSIHGSGSSSGDDIYNTTTSSIIDYTGGIDSMRLRTQDFAYLRNYGVYPNNRLMVARRFKSPVEDDLTSVTQKPISTLVSWFEGEKPPLKISFGEEWENGQGNLVDLLSSVMGKNVGGGLKALDSFFKGGVPFSGFSEGLQYELLSQLGVTDKGLQDVPSGNPNLIQESKKRRLVGDGGGSTMKTTIDIQFETIYEQKFIGGSDPTLVYLDILNNILRFGSSESNFYINSKGGDMMRDFLEKFRKGKWVEAISVIVGSIVQVLSNVVEKLFDAVKAVGETVGTLLEGDGDPISNIVSSALESISGAIISKHRVEIGGIISSLTGEASTPWHIVIGNPKSPIFSSGDMYTQNVTIELGEVLAFNDLPSSIKVSFQLSNARNLGIQEIFGKFNAGKGRSYVNKDKSSLESPINEEDVDAALKQGRDNPNVKSGGDGILNRVDGDQDTVTEGAGEVSNNDSDVEEERTPGTETGGGS